MHGQYNSSIEKELVSEEDNLLWLVRGDLKHKLKVK
jgi:hypothetical protein